MRLSLTLLGSAALLAACSTTSQNPIYQQSTQYKGSIPYSGTVQGVQQASGQVGQAVVHSAGYQTVGTNSVQPSAPITYSPQTGLPVQNGPIVYSQSDIYSQSVRSHAQHNVSPSSTAYQASTGQNTVYPSTAAHQECLSRETNRKLIGGVGGAVVGGIAGNKLYKDKPTLGAAAGAAIGGAAGWGTADKTIDCDHLRPTVVATPASYHQPSSHYPAHTTTTTAVPSTPNPLTASYPSHSTSGSGITSPLASQTSTSLPSGNTLTETTHSLGDAGTPGYYAINGTGAHSTSGLSAGQSGNSAISSIPYTQPAPALSAASGNSYIVQPGDTVYSLSKRFCVSVSEFQDANGIDNNFYIRAGEALQIPANGC